MKRKVTTERKQELASKFGGCGCKDHCAMEQFSAKEAAGMKPRGRFTVCQIEAEELGLTLKEVADDD